MGFVSRFSSTRSASSSLASASWLTEFQKFDLCSHDQVATSPGNACRELPAKTEDSGRLAQTRVPLIFVIKVSFE